MFSFFMKILEEEKGISWTSFSFLDITDAIQTISAACDKWNIEVHPGNDYIQSDGFNIRFVEKNHGCDLTVYIWKDTKALWIFLVLWARMQNKGTVIKGGKYKKEFDNLFQEFDIKKQNKESETSNGDKDVAGENHDENEEELRKVCINWVSDGDKLHRDSFDVWKSQRTVSVWITRTVVYDYLKNKLLPEGVVEKKGREYILTSRKNKKN
jgi:hypothetical protein